MSSSRVRLTVSPENFPLTLYARACLDPTKPARVIPEKLPSGSNARFRIGTLDRASDSTPNNWPRVLVRRTSQSPQRVPGIARPWTLQIPSASLAGAVVIGSAACTDETAISDAHTPMSRKRNNPRTTVPPVRSIT